MTKKHDAILIIGAAGGLARILTGVLSQSHPNTKIIGVDSRSLRTTVEFENFQFQKMKYTRGKFEKLFREHRFDTIYHLGRMSHAKSSSQNEIAKRLNLNLIGTNKILELAIHYKVEKLIVLSTHHVYGALADNHVFIKEDSPLRASIKYPELRDVTEMDSLCTNWMWRYKDQIETVILRPCNIIGPQIKNSITEYLRTNHAPVPIDFNPMFQFIHELDMANILMKAMDRLPTGVYNVAPKETISLDHAIKIIGRKTTPLPLFLLGPLATIVKRLWTFPDYLIDYIKYSCIIDASSLNEHIPDDEMRFTTEESLKLLNL